ncbi:diguanylate cyclase [Rhodanobacter sp. FW510-R12]
MLLAVWAIWLLARAGAVIAAEPQHASLPQDPAQLLKLADGAESNNIDEFNALMQRLDDSKLRLSPQQQLHRRYLDARQIVFRGDFKTALPLMKAIADQSEDPTLSFRAAATTVDLLVTQSRYEEAFARLSLLLEELPRVTEGRVRIQALGVASQLYLEAGQYDLAIDYAEQLIKGAESPKSACIGWYYKLDALLRAGRWQIVEEKIRNGREACDRAGNILIAGMFKTVVAKLEIERGRSAEAISLLQENYADVQRKRYPPLVSDFDDLLAQAYWKRGDAGLAKIHALRVVEKNKSIGGVYSASTASAYRVLYQVEEKQGDLGEALAYLKGYMVADKGYLDDVSAKALAYQTVKQQVLAKKLQIEGLDKKNRILTLQDELDRKAAETSRLYIALLLLVLASIALWAYRVKRSQLRFMRLARRDGLTGIFNRQHFVNEAERQLRYCRKSARDVCLVLIDLDHFKLVNDTHGHAVGDRVLKRAVDACQAHLRSTDVFGRLGGEEFGVLLPECTLDSVLPRVEQMRTAIAAASSAGDAPAIPISASFGIAAAASSGYELRQLMIDADRAMYRAKHEGRNRIRVYEVGMGS